MNFLNHKKWKIIMANPRAQRYNYPFSQKPCLPSALSSNLFIVPFYFIFLFTDQLIFISNGIKKSNNFFNSNHSLFQLCFTFTFSSIASAMGFFFNFIFIFYIYFNKKEIINLRWFGKNKIKKILNGVILTDVSMPMWINGDSTLQTL
jgi:hypothetical protein